MTPASTTNAVKNEELEQMVQLLRDSGLTHGYVHGHVHQHNDHMHIHGHIHNHDHNLDVQSQALDSHALNFCREFDEFDVCKDMFCDELDDCYFFDCDDSKNLANTLDHHADCGLLGSLGYVECCEDPDCLSGDEVCDDPKCVDDHTCTDHNNSLCESQKPKIQIFENLIQNVQKGIERLLVPPHASDAGSSRKRQKVDSDVQIHFPHRCHLSPKLVEEGGISSENMAPILPSSDPYHHTHQSCFHAKVKPNAVPSTTEKQQSDFDFFIQFNNFNLLFDDENKLFSQVPVMEQMPQSPNAPSLYSCKWENCFKKVDDQTLLNHLIDEHINDDYRLGHQEKIDSQAFQCEWNNCNFVDDNLTSFLSHLNSHKDRLHDISLHGGNGSRDRASPLLTPMSTVSTSSPQTVKKYDKHDIEMERYENGLNITAMKISPKEFLSCCQPLDPKFTCRWQIGKDKTRNPILCNKTHESEGELQQHLQDDHIGLGKPVYNCCWLGCDRNEGKPFVQRQKLFRHIHIHTNYKPCKCHICGSSFAVPATLKQHMRTHSGEKPFSCNICGKRFTTSSSLSIHNRVHSGERPLECKWPGCGKRFSESSNLAKHMRVHSKSFECEVCGEVFDKKTEYTRHKKFHSKVKVESPPLIELV